MDIAKIIEPKINIDKIVDIIDFIDNLEGPPKYFIGDLLRNYLSLQRDSDKILQSLITIIKDSDIPIQFPSDVPETFYPEETDHFIRYFSPYLLIAMNDMEIKLSDITMIENPEKLT